MFIPRSMSRLDFFERTKLLLQRSCKLSEWNSKSSRRERTIAVVGFLDT